MSAIASSSGAHTLDHHKKLLTISLLDASSLISLREAMFIAFLLEENSPRRKEPIMTAVYKLTILKGDLDVMFKANNS